MCSAVTEAGTRWSARINRAVEIGASAFFASCLTNLAAEGVPDTVARSISGHRTASVHARYQITQESAKRDALAAMSERVTQLARGTV